MTDPRLKKLTYVLLHYSAKLKRKQIVKLIGDVESLPLLKELYAEALAMGAYPYTKITDDDFSEIFFKRANKDQLAHILPMEKYEIDKIDALVFVRASSNTRALTGTDPKKQAMAQKARGKLNQKFHKRAAAGELSWVPTQYPTNAGAQDAGMSLTDYEDFIYGACMVDRKDPIAEWKKMSKYNQRLINYLKRKKVIHIVAPDTDITFKVGGRKWINCDGDNNFPDGEVFTAPVENSANGHIRFSFPAV